ncbi:hypothetical protein PV433_27330 [Paenibacillus sp. GYB004]|uniref:hypothetical protein n=1 Tax=Paenibacillus sp. GYB004 TaxID=2994393 RepID=UPI002F96269E
MSAELKNLIRIGKVSTVNAANGTVRVVFPDKDDSVSGELPVLRLGGTLAMPSVGDNAVCLFLGNGLRAGFFLGTYGSGNSGEVKIDGDLLVNGDVTINGTLHGGGVGP